MDELVSLMGSQINIGASEWEKLCTRAQELRRIMSYPHLCTQRHVYEAQQSNRLYLDAICFSKSDEDEQFVEFYLRQSLIVSDPLEVLGYSLLAYDRILTLISGDDGLSSDETAGCLAQNLAHLMLH